MNIIQQIEAVANYMQLEGQHEDWCGNNVISHNAFMDEEFMRPYRPNESWDDLMPVIEKISKHEYEPYQLSDGQIAIDTAYPVTFGMPNAAGNPMVRFNRCPLFEGATLIEAAWFAVCDFINGSTEPA